jgi:pilus assembly protein CpaF
MINRTLMVQSAEPGDGARTVARHLAEAWTEKASHVLLFSIDPEADAITNAMDWRGRFDKLAPDLLRNYFMRDHFSPSLLTLNAIPALDELIEMFPPLKRAYDWIVVVAPWEEAPEFLALLDHCDLLLWVTRREHSMHGLRKKLDELSAAHFPHAFSQFVFNRTAATARKLEKIRDLTPSRPVLGNLPEDPGPGFRLQEAIQHLSDRLSAQEDLWTLKRNEAPAAAPTDQVIQELKNRVQPELLKVLGAPLHRGDGLPVAATALAHKAIETCLAEDKTLSASRQERGHILDRVLGEVLGLGPLEPYLKDSRVSEIMVNGKDRVYIEIQGRLHETEAKFSSEAQLRTVIDRIVAPIGRRVDESMPLCDARLSDGSRVNIVLPPLALDGPTLTIRKFTSHALTFHDLVAGGSLSFAMAEFLDHCVKKRKNIIISGGTGSGKTTLLNALSSLIPDDERIVTIEDAAELRLQKPHVVRLESRSPNVEGEGAIPIRRLVMNALRMRPDRIVVGECRGGEALDMLQAMNTGHDGSLTTLHANSPRDGLGRLETMVLMAGMDLPVRVVREQIRSGVQFVIQQARLADGSRKVTSIAEVTGLEGDTLSIQEIFCWRDGEFKSTGMRARCLEKESA